MRSAIKILIFLWMCSSAHASTFFTDGFESGDSTHTENGVTWGSGGTITTDNPRTGSYSIRFAFPATADNVDSSREKRFYLTTPLSEFWVRMWIWIPANYKHRLPSDTSTNNKFLAIYANPYGDPGFQMNLSTSRVNDYQSTLDIHKYNNGPEAPPISNAYASFIVPDDFGEWVEIITRVKVPTDATSSDGIVQVWKNSVLIADHQSVAMFGSDGRNYIDQGYILGWSNSGYDEETIFYIDDVEFSGTAIVPSEPEDPETTTASGPILRTGSSLLRVGGGVLRVQ